MPDWRILQVFLSPKRPAVYEVQMDSATRDLRCTCPANTGARTCRHIKFARARMTQCGGTYPLRVNAASVADYDAAEQNPETYRAFILHHTRIEVL